MSEVARDRRLGNLTTPTKVQELQTALHAKAKAEPGFRFYLLYDKVYRRDVLEVAYRQCKANDGAPGADGVRFEDIEAEGVEGWLGELAERLRRKDYRPSPVKRVWIPKPNGKLRPSERVKHFETPVEGNLVSSTCAPLGRLALLLAG